MRHPKAICVFILLVLIVFSTTLTAQYRFDQWTTENGLPQNSVNSIVQTRDGYIWFTTFGGLVRFDGIKFKIFNTINAPTFKSNRLIRATEAPDGSLLIGGQNGDLISYKDDVFRPIIQNPVSQRTPLGIFRGSKNGEIWNLGKSGLERRTPDASGNWLVSTVEIPNEPQPFVNGIAEDNSNNIWVSTPLGLYRFNNGAVTSFPFKDNFPQATDNPGQQVIRLLIDRKNRIWVYSADFLARFENERFIPILQKRGGNFDIAENLDGTFFLRLDGKIYRFADDKVQETLIDDDSINASYRFMMSDRERNIWIGTNGQGLRRYKQQTARTLGKAEGLIDGPVNFVFEDRDKNIWIGADALYKYRDGKFERFPEAWNFNSAFQSSDGRLWFEAQTGIYNFKDGKFTDFGKESGIRAYSVFEDSRGTFYYVVEKGLITVQNGARREFSGVDGFVPGPVQSSTVQSIIETNDGGVWFATTGGVYRFKDGAFTNYSSENGLSNDNVRDIYQDRDGTIWMGTYGGGLNRLKDGKMFAITTREGLNEDIVSRILVDEKDNFWMLGNRGVSVISRSALNDLADGKIKTIACESYGVSDGMLNSEGNGGHHPAGWRASDGKFWFPSIQGVIVIEPAPSDLPPPPVYIEDVFLSGKQVESAPKIEVAPGTENLEIHYAGLNFSKPEQVKFRYKLEGFDQDWIEVGNRRAAYYTNVPPGNYRFLVTASTTSGIWNEQPAGKDVIVLSDPIWKKWWFILSASILVILALVIFYRLRLLQLEKTRQRQQEFSRALIESQEQERKRIAGELHDGLGQTLLIIKNRAFLGTKANDLAIANEQLSEISASSGAAIDQAREIAYYLRPSQLERFGLTSAIEEMIRQAGESSEIDFESRVESLDGIFSPENEINFYRIVQEGVNNVLKHSEATSAGVIIKRTDGKVELFIEDNGKGLPGGVPNAKKSAGFGLFGIEERLRILGGKLSINSAPGNGTRVSITIENPK